MSKIDDNFEMESLNADYNDDETLLKDIMSQNIGTKKEFALPAEISHKKKLIANMFNTKFGKSFLNRKPEYLIMMEKLLQKYLFDPDSKFLNKLPALQKKLRIERKMNEEMLTAKINMGEMTFYNLRDKNNKNIRIITNSKEKLLGLSKNFASHNGKDIVTNQFYKIKFWDRNAKRIDKLFAKSNKSRTNLNNSDISNNEDEGQFIEFENENDDIEKNNTNNISNNNDESIEYILMKNSLTDKRTPIKIGKYSIDTSPNMGTGGYNKLFLVDKNDSHSYNKLFLSNYSNTNNNCENSNVPKNYKLKINNNKRGSFFRPFKTSYNGFNDSVPKSNILNTNNNFNKTASNYFKKRNKKSFSSNTRNIVYYKDFDNLLKSTTRIHSKNINRVMEKFRILSTKFKSKFDNKISNLNKYTNKCNNKLYKLIDGNNTENATVKEQAMLKKDKLDLKEVLFGKDFPKKKKDNVVKNENIKTIVKNITYEEENKKNKILLRKKINNIPDDLALEMVEYSVRNKRKEFNLKEILKGSERKKTEVEEKRIKNSRKKLEANYIKMIKLEKNIFYEQAKILSEEKKKIKAEKNNHYNYNNKTKNFNRQSKLKKCFSGGYL